MSYFDHVADSIALDAAYLKRSVPETIGRFAVKAAQELDDVVNRKPDDDTSDSTNTPGNTGGENNEVVVSSEIGGTVGSSDVDGKE